MTSKKLRFWLFMPLLFICAAAFILLLNGGQALHAETKIPTLKISDYANYSEQSEGVYFTNKNGAIPLSGTGIQNGKIMLYRTEPSSLSIIWDVDSNGNWTGSYWWDTDSSVPFPDGEYTIYVQNGIQPDNSETNKIKVIINAYSPQVVSCSGTPGTYKSGENINFNLEFSEKVVVTGTPKATLQLFQGSTKVGEVSAEYQSGSGTSILSFRYTVSAAVQADRVEISGIDNNLIRDTGDFTAGLSGTMELLGVKIDAANPSGPVVTVPETPKPDPSPSTPSPSPSPVVTTPPAVSVAEVPTGISNPQAVGMEPDKGAFDKPVDLRIKENTEVKSAIEQAIKEKLPEISTDLPVIALDISLYTRETATKVQPAEGTSVTITYPIPQSLMALKDNLVVVRVVDGKLEVLPTTLLIKDDVYCVRFKTDHFSPYALVADTSGKLSTLEAGASVKDTAVPISPNAVPYAVTAVLLTSGIILFIQMRKRS